jgi:RecA/RadA recombinase
MENCATGVINPVSALYLYQQRKLLSTGCGSIDRLLRGGIDVGGHITEIVGESASGKTQVLMYLFIYLFLF